MLNNFFDVRILLIMISLTLFYFYITDTDNIVFEINYSKPE